MKSLARSRPQYLYVGAIVWVLLVVALASVRGVGYQWGGGDAR